MTAPRVHSRESSQLASLSGALIFFLIGFGLICSSYLWALVVPREWRWTDEQAKRHSDNSAEYHRAAIEAGNAKQRKAPQAAELENKRRFWEQKYQQSQAALEAVKANDQTLQKVCFWSGILLVAAGLALLLKLQFAE